MDGGLDCLRSVSQLSSQRRAQQPRSLLRLRTSVPHSSPLLLAEVQARAVASSNTQGIESSARKGMASAVNRPRDPHRDQQAEALPPSRRHLQRKVSMLYLIALLAALADPPARVSAYLSGDVHSPRNSALGPH
jgi:hypothetical protein